MDTVLSRHPLSGRYSISPKNVSLCLMLSTSIKRTRTTKSGLKWLFLRLFKTCFKRTIITDYKLKKIKTNHVIHLLWSIRPVGPIIGELNRTRTTKSGLKWLFLRLFKTCFKRTIITDYKLKKIKTNHVIHLLWSIRPVGPIIGELNRRMKSVRRKSFIKEASFNLISRLVELLLGYSRNYGQENCSLLSNFKVNNSLQRNEAAKTKLR